MKYIDILSDKIDYLFRRGKNADDRTYDFFIRTVTFLILALIILCYGSFVHADGNTIISYYNIDISLLTNPSEIKWNHADVNKFMNIKMETTGVEYRNLPSGGSPVQSILYVSGMPDLNSNYVLIEQTSGDWEEIWFIPKSYIDSGQMVLVADGEDTRIYSSVDYTFTLYSVNYTEVADIEKYREYNIRSVSAGNSIRPGQFEPAWSYHAAWSNAPYYLTSSLPSYSDVETFVNNGMVDDYPIFYNSNYYTFMDGLLEQPWGSGSIDNIESNKNHMYFNDVQIGISSVNNGSTLDSSSVIIGCSVDDWINNNIDDYSVKVTYTLNGKFEDLSAWNFDYFEVMPLKTFTNNVYVKSMHDIFVGMGYYNSNTYQAVNDYYNIWSTMTYNGGFPTLLNKSGQVISKSIGNFKANSKNDNVPNILQEYSLNVDVQLIAQGVQEPSDSFIKKFDFMRGTESIVNSDGLRNNDPWTGEENPQVDPYVPDVGSANGMNQINNNNQTVNINLDNRFQNIVSGGATNDDYDDTIDNIKSLFGTFKESLAVMGDSTLDQDNQPNGFVGLLQSSYSFIPGMPYYILGIVIIVALCVLLFIIKALVF